MTATRLVVPALCVAVGFGIGAYVYPGPYSYATANGAVVSRVNRVTGVEEYASSKGWVPRSEAVRDAMAGGLSGMGEALRSLGSSPSNEAVAGSAPSSTATAGSLGPPTQD